MEDTDDTPRYYTTKVMGIGAHTMTREEYYRLSEGRDRHLGDPSYQKHDFRIRSAP